MEQDTAIKSDIMPQNKVYNITQMLVKSKDCLFQKLLQKV